VRIPEFKTLYHQKKREREREREKKKKDRKYLYKISITTGCSYGKKTKIRTGELH
jgi:hypothetical protein